MFAFAAAIVLQAGMPEDLRSTLKAFLDRDANVSIGVLHVSVTGNDQKEAPRESLLLSVTRDKIRAEQNRNYGVWDGNTGIFVSRTDSGVTYRDCKTERQVLEPFGIADALLGPAQKGDWLPGDWSGDSPRSYMFGFGWKVDGMQDVMSWSLDKPGGEIQAVQIVTPQGQALLETVFVIDKVDKLVAVPTAFSATPPAGAVKTSIHLQ
jgi:hypothetical protein